MSDRRYTVLWIQNNEWGACVLPVCQWEGFARAVAQCFGVTYVTAVEHTEPWIPPEERCA